MDECPSCGHTNRRNVRFCTRCGASLDAQSTSDAPRDADPVRENPARRGLADISTSRWSNSLAGGRRVALLVREAALAARGKREASTRGDLAAAVAQSQMQSEMPIALVTTFRRDADGQVEDWGPLSSLAGTGMPDLFFTREPAIRDQGQRLMAKLQPGDVRDG